MILSMPVVDHGGVPGWPARDCAAESSDEPTDIQSARPHNIPTSQTVLEQTAVNW